MNTTNEQAALQAEKEIQLAHHRHHDELRAFIQFNGEDHPVEKKQQRFLDLHRNAIAFFNLGEQSVADSSLLGAHRDEWWAKNKAETSMAVLNAVLNFYASFREMTAALQLPPETMEPASTAFASMQRIVKLHYPEKATELREMFAAAGLPTMGFDAPLPPRATQGAAIKFKDGEVEHVEGLTSSDAASFLKGRSRVVSGETSVTGAYSGDQVVQVVGAAKGSGAGNHLRSWRNIRSTGFIVLGTIAIAAMVGVIYRAVSPPLSTSDDPRTQCIREVLLSKITRDTNAAGNLVTQLKGKASLDLQGSGDVEEIRRSLDQNAILALGACGLRIKSKITVTRRTAALPGVKVVLLGGSNTECVTDPEGRCEVDLSELKSSDPLRLRVLYDGQWSPDSGPIAFDEIAKGSARIDIFDLFGEPQKTNLREFDLHKSRINFKVPDAHQTHGLELLEGGQADDLFRFYVVAGRGARYSLEDVSLELEWLAECPLRDECSEVQAPEQVNEFIIPLSREYSKYPLIPLQIPKKQEWVMTGPEAQVFTVQLVYEPYVLYVFKAVVIARDLVKGTTLRLESPSYGALATANGNSGGCHDLRQWLDAAKHQKPSEKRFDEGLSPQEYSILIFRPDDVRNLEQQQMRSKSRFGDLKLSREIEEYNIRSRLSQTTAAALFPRMVQVAEARQLPQNWLPTLYELESASKGRRFTPEGTIKAAGRLGWLVMSTAQLYGRYDPELRRIAAYRDLVDAAVSKNPRLPRPYWQSGRLEATDYKRCSKSNSLIDLPMTTTYTLKPPM
ncbi:hypothetical protein CYFUS_006726 [Cystobacter fuscus]|uniref:Uncharacterized protein n=1 Tax=Cystobacter fuscus TaxID=43 RepID=A0A250JCZ2_9BACT|nr:hypothetical protein [Cystobacter fuscus]ATB41261.1 hypothetical protein CYFUS_006726 [Cystobacter fuscus]